MQRQTKNKKLSKVQQFKKIEALIKKAFIDVDKYVQKDLKASQKISISFK